MVFLLAWSTRRRAARGGCHAHSTQPERVAGTPPLRSAPVTVVTAPDTLPRSHRVPSPNRYPDITQPRSTPSRGQHTAHVRRFPAKPGAHRRKERSANLGSDTLSRSGKESAEPGSGVGVGGRERRRQPWRLRAHTALGDCSSCSFATDTAQRSAPALFSTPPATDNPHRRTGTRTHHHTAFVTNASTAQRGGSHGGRSGRRCCSGADEDNAAR